MAVPTQVTQELAMRLKAHELELEPKVQALVQPMPRLPPQQRGEMILNWQDPTLPSLVPICRW